MTEGISPGENHRGEITGGDHRGNHRGKSPGDITGEKLPGENYRGNLPGKITGGNHLYPKKHGP